MKKKIILLAGSLMALAAVTTTVVATNSNSEASLLTQNVEALAQNESGLGCDWIITFYSVDHWRCDRGGSMCC